MGMLTFKVPITTAADDNFDFFQRADDSHETSRIKNKKINRMLSAAILLSTLRINALDILVF